MVLLALTACSPSTAPRAGVAPTSSGGDDVRLRRARREMGLAEAVAGGERDDDDDDDGAVPTPFALGEARLPAPPRGIRPDEDPLAIGLARAREALEPGCPTPPDTLAAASVSAWFDAEFTGWLRGRGERLRAARLALGAGEQGSLGAQVLASAVVGTLFARLAAEVAELPVPRAYLADEGAALRFRQALFGAAAPLWSRAIDAFGACASASVDADDASFARWQRWCDAEGERAASEHLRAEAWSSRGPGAPSDDGRAEPSSTR